MVNDTLEHLLFPLARRNKGAPRGVVQHWERKSDATWWRLGRVLNRRDPAVCLVQELVAGEERACMAIGTHSEQDQVKDGEACRVFLGKLSDEDLFVRVRNFLGVIQQASINGVDVGIWDGHM